MVALVVQNLPARLWLIRHGESAGNVARDQVEDAGLPLPEDSSARHARSRCCTARRVRGRAPQGDGSRSVILTPHAGEMARLWGIEREEVCADPRMFALEAAAKLGAIIVLKGAHTHVTAPDGTTFRNTAGNLGLGTSGSGDTLAGVIAGLCARGAEPLQAAVWGVYLHAKAGEVLARKLGPLGFLARELLIEIPPLLGKLGARTVS